MVSVAAQQATTNLAQILFGSSVASYELPELHQLGAALAELASCAKRKVRVPLTHIPFEVALVRNHDDVLLSFYGTESAPEARVLNRAVPLDAALAAVRDAANACASSSSSESNGYKLALRLLENVHIRPEQDPPNAVVTCGGGQRTAPAADVPLLFGFSATIAPIDAPAPQGSFSADVHATLFEGTLWLYTRGRRVALGRGPIFLAVQRMVVAVHALIEAWEHGRHANVRLRSGGFTVGVRLNATTEEVTLTFGSDAQQSIAVTALDVPGAALPILRVASELVRSLVSADRTQNRNLRVRALRDEVRSLRKHLVQRSRTVAFVNDNPDRLRVGTGDAVDDASSTVAPCTTETRLRFLRRWHSEIDGLDAGATFLCGDRLVVATSKHAVALSRDSGEILWARAGACSTSFMAGTVLVRVSPEGEVELCDVTDGEPFAVAKIAPRIAGSAQGLMAGGGSTPPAAVLVEGTNRVVAVDLRTGEPRWRFSSRAGGPLRMQRAGRVLVVGEPSAVQAIDVATGDVVWRFANRARFSYMPLVCRETVIVPSSDIRGRAGALYGLDLYSGHVRWHRELDGPPTSAPIAAGAHAAICVGGSRRTNLASFAPTDGELHWMVPDPGVESGAACLAFDRMLVINAPGGRLQALALGTGEPLWSRTLSDPLTDDVPRRLEPVLRGGALFVPAASVHVIRPKDGSSLGDALPCELVPDLIRVDERGWIYIAEESGHIAAYAPVPQLMLVKG